MSEFESKNPLLVGPMNMPKLPVGGFFIRLAAFIIDMLFLLATLHFLRGIASGFFWAAGAWSPYVSGGLCFLYFALGNGPVGNGRTIGKLFLGLQTTGYDDQPPLLRQTALRTLVLIPVFWMGPMLDAFFGRSDSIVLRWLVTQAPGYSLLAMFFATFLGVAFNPFKQGLHDYFSQTIVRKRRDINDPVPSFEEMTEEVGTGWLKFHRQPIYSCGIAFVSIFIALIALTWPTQEGPGFRLYDELFRIKVEPWFGQDYISFPTEQDQIENMFKFLELDETLLAPIDAATTGTVSLFVRVEKNGGWENPAANSAYHPILDESMTQYHAQVLPRVLELFEESNSELEQQIFQDWSQADTIQLHYLFLSLAKMDPYPNPLRRADGIYTKEFPAIPLLVETDE